MDSILATLQPPVRSVLSPVLVGGDMAIRLTLPTTGLLAWIVDGEDTIGLSIAAIYVAVPVAHRSIYSADGVNWNDWPTIITNIAASPYLNNGGELAGNPTKGYVQYIDGTTETILRRAYTYLGEAYPEAEYWKRADGTNILRADGTPIEVHQ